MSLRRAILYQRLMFGPALYKLGEVPYIQDSMADLDSLLVPQKTSLDEASSPSLKDTIFLKWTHFSEWIYFWYFIFKMGMTSFFQETYLCSQRVLFQCLHVSFVYFIASLGQEKW